jgi:tetratricopeptide (TPR) repeat protein
LATCAKVHISVKSYEKAQSYLDRSIKQDPHRALTWITLSELQLAQQDYANAAQSATRAIAISPYSTWVYKRRAVAFFHLGRYREALADLSAGLTPQDTTALIWIPLPSVAACPDQAFKDGLLQLATDAVAKNPAVRSRRAAIALHLGRWDIVREDFAELAKGEKARHTEFYQLAMSALADHRNLTGYRAACRDMLAKFGDSPDPDAVGFTGWTCALVPGALEDYAPALTAAQRAFEAAPERSELRRSLGALQYRAEQHAAAVKTLEPLFAAGDTPADPKTSHAYPLYFLAMAQQRTGQTAAAKASLTQAMALTEQEFSRPDTLAWNRKLTLELLRDEAVTLIGPIAFHPPAPALPEPAPQLPTPVLPP